jgi:hypothetical protein
MVSSRPKQSTRPVFKFYNAKSVFLPVNASLRWLNNVSGVYLTQVSLLLIVQQDLVDFFRYRPFLPIGWRIVQILRQRRGKQQILRQLLFVQQASPLLSMKKYTPLVISRNDKNRQLTIIKPRKLALTAINKTFCIKNHRSPQKFKNHLRSLVRPSSVYLSKFF